MSAPADQQWPDDAICRAEQHAPDDEDGTPDRFTTPIEPDDRRHQHRQGSELGDAEHEHHCCQHRSEWYACQGQTKAAQHRLSDRSHDYAESDAADRLACQKDGLFASLAGETTTEAADEAGRALAASIEYHGDNDGQDELYEQNPKAAQCADEPRRSAARVRRRLGHKWLDPAGRGVCPSRG